MGPDIDAPANWRLPDDDSRTTGDLAGCRLELASRYGFEFGSVLPNSQGSAGEQRATRES